MKRILFLAVAVFCLSSCGVDPNANADGDCMTDAQELELGTDPDKADADADADAPNNAVNASTFKNLLINLPLYY